MLLSASSALSVLSSVESISVLSVLSSIESLFVSFVSSTLLLSSPLNNPVNQFQIFLKNPSSFPFELSVFDSVLAVVSSVESTFTLSPRILSLVSPKIPESVSSLLKIPVNHSPIPENQSLTPSKNPLSTFSPIASNLSDIVFPIPFNVFFISL